MANYEDKKELTAGGIPRHRSGIMRRLTGLKILAMVYKTLSILVLFVLAYQLVMTWYYGISNKASVLQCIYASVSIIVIYGFCSLFLITVARILKTLKKIRHAVEYNK